MFGSQTWMGECSIYSLLATQILDLFAERQQRLFSMGTYTYRYCGRIHAQKHTHTILYNLLYVCTVHIRIVGARIIVINHFSTVGMTVQSDWYNTDGAYTALLLTLRIHRYIINDRILAQPAYIFIPVQRFPYNAIFVSVSTTIEIRLIYQRCVSEMKEFENIYNA